ncbi:MAG: peptidoglycan editing factor PgeF [Micrococcales bacterium]|nr:peptidoglycan editing factor PgeF [Micrococcales bacterium]
MKELVAAVDLGPGVRAGFTTRSGGVSAPPWDSLNLAGHVGDDPAAVAANRDAVAAWLGVPVAYATQVHGAHVRCVAGPPPPGTLSVGEADALVTTSTQVGLGVLVADCAPVLLADPQAGVVAAAHAGRPGLVAGVVQATVAAMRDLGAQVDRVVAVVGPCVAGRSYEVPASLRDDVAAAVPGTGCVTDWGTPGVDVAAGVRGVLAGLGVRRVEVVGTDTYHEGSLFSYRRDGPVTGRFAGLVRLLGPGALGGSPPSRLRGTIAATMP